MPYANILDKKTGQTLKALDFGGPTVYKVNDKFVYAPEGGTSVTFEEKVATLKPLNLTSVLEDKWEIISHQDTGTANWRVTVKNHSTQEIKTGVYPFNLNGNVYELKDCAPGTWVIASCGGYKIESSWSGQTSNQAFRLKGTGEVIFTFRFWVWDYGNSGRADSTNTGVSWYNPYYSADLICAAQLGLPEEAFKQAVFYTGSISPYWRYGGVATVSNGGGLTFRFNGSNWISNINLPVTGSWTYHTYFGTGYSHYDIFIGIVEQLKTKEQVLKVAEGILKAEIDRLVPIKTTYISFSGVYLGKKTKPITSLNVAPIDTGEVLTGETVVTRQKTVGISGLAIDNMTIAQKQELVNSLLG